MSAKLDKPERTNQTRQISQPVSQVCINRDISTMAEAVIRTIKTYGKQNRCSNY